MVYVRQNTAHLKASARSRRGSRLALAAITATLVAAAAQAMPVTPFGAIPVAGFPGISPVSAHPAPGVLPGAGFNNAFGLSGGRAALTTSFSNPAASGAFGGIPSVAGFGVAVPGAPASPLGGANSSGLPFGISPSVPASVLGVSPGIAIPNTPLAGLGLLPRNFTAPTSHIARPGPVLVRLPGGAGFIPVMPAAPSAGLAANPLAAGPFGPAPSAVLGLPIGSISSRPIAPALGALPLRGPVTAPTNVALAPSAMITPPSLAALPSISPALANVIAPIAAPPAVPSAPVLTAIPAPTVGPLGVASPAAVPMAIASLAVMPATPLTTPLVSPIGINPVAIPLSAAQPATSPAILPTAPQLSASTIPALSVPVLGPLAPPLSAISNSPAPSNIAAAPIATGPIGSPAILVALPVAPLAAATPITTPATQPVAAIATPAPTPANNILATAPTPVAGATANVPITAIKAAPIAQPHAATTLPALPVAVSPTQGAIAGAATPSTPAPATAIPAALPGLTLPAQIAAQPLAPLANLFGQPAAAPVALTPAPLTPVVPLAITPLPPQIAGVLNGTVADEICHPAFAHARVFPKIWPAKMFDKFVYQFPHPLENVKHFFFVEQHNYHVGNLFFPTLVFHNFWVPSYLVGQYRYGFDVRDPRFVRSALGFANRPVGHHPLFNHPHQGFEAFLSNPDADYYELYLASIFWVNGPHPLYMIEDAMTTRVPLDMYSTMLRGYGPGSYPAAPGYHSLSYGAPDGQVLLGTYSPPLNGYSDTGDPIVAAPDPESAVIDVTQQGYVYPETEEGSGPVTLNNEIKGFATWGTPHSVAYDEDSAVIGSGARSDISGLGHRPNYRQDGSAVVQ